MELQWTARGNHRGLQPLWQESARSIISLASASPTRAFKNRENCIALNANGSATLFNSCSERVAASAATLSVSRSQRPHLRAEITLQTYLCSSGSAASL